MLKALGFDTLKAHYFQDIGFKYQPAPNLHPYTAEAAFPAKGKTLLRGLAPITAHQEGAWEVIAGSDQRTLEGTPSPHHGKAVQVDIRLTPR